MKFFLSCFITISFLTLSYGQSDSTEYETYDVIYLVKGGILKGEILSFDEEFGGIVFKDTYGRTYSLAREEYDYFIENQSFPVKKKKAVRERKTNGIGLSAGLFTNFLNIQQDFKQDENYVNAQDAISDLQFGLKLAVGTYFNENNFIGLATEIPFVSESKRFFNVGFRYAYRQDSHKKNAVFYIPVELKFHSIEYSLDYSASDTTFSDGGYSWPSNRQVNTSFNTLALNFGPGISFVLENQKSINLEATFTNHFILSQEFKDVLFVPNSDFRMTSIMLALFYNF